MAAVVQRRRNAVAPTLYRWGGRDPRHLRRSDSSWDFRGEDTKYATHGIYRYPAMMVAPVVRRLIEENNPAEDGGRLLDPFCGSGSVLIEAMLNGMAAVGTDINPLAILLSQVRTTPLAQEQVDKEIRVIEARFTDLSSGSFRPDMPTLADWYSAGSIRNLSRLREAIQGIRRPELRRFFLAAYAEAARHVSYTRLDEYKVFRISPDKRPKWTPDVWETFARIVTHNTEKMADFVQRLPRGAKQARILKADSRVTGAIPHGPYDLIVTSPPYGDSHTTVAYGQFSSLSLAWLGQTRAEVNGIDRTSLGGRPTDSYNGRPDSATLSRHLDKIREVDPHRAREVLAFYLDLRTAFRNIAAELAPGGMACVVVGNRTVSQERLETDVILSELFEHECGLVHLETIVRGIPNKVMPLRNSPSNVAGAVGETMANEYILVLERPAS